MMDNASPEDSVIIGDRLAQITAAFEALQRNAAARRRALEHGLAQASEGKRTEINSELETVPISSCSHGEKLKDFLTYSCKIKFESGIRLT